MHLLSKRLPSVSAERSPSPLKIFTLRNRTGVEGPASDVQASSAPDSRAPCPDISLHGKETHNKLHSERRRNSPSACLSEARL